MAAVPLRLIQKPANRWIASHKRSIQRINAFLKHKEVNPNVQEAILLVCKFPRMVRRPKSQRAAILDGTLDSTARHVVRTRLPVVYNPDAPTPTKWIAFLDELLFPEDIPMFQEFVGYLLLPTTLFGVMTTASRR